MNINLYIWGIPLFVLLMSNLIKNPTNEAISEAKRNNNFDEIKKQISENISSANDIDKRLVKIERTSDKIEERLKRGL